MRVGIDAHTLGTGAGGNETYVRELLCAFRQCAPETDLVAYVDPKSCPDDDTVAAFPRHPLAFRPSVLRVPLALPWAIRCTGPDLLHVQYAAPPCCPCPFVVSIHDVVWKSHPELLGPVMRARLAWLTPNTVRRAARVFVLTEAVKGDLLETFDFPADRIDVVSPGVDPMFHRVDEAARVDAVRRKYSLPKDYVLYVGALQPRKNLARLAAASARLAAGGLPHALVIAGPRIWRHQEVLRQFEGLGLEDRLCLVGYVEQEDLPALISDASAFAYVSIYEGFGLPVLEAMACGTPVLASADPAISEVAGGAVLHCDAFDVDAIADALCRILTDGKLRARLRAAGPERAEAYTRRNRADAALAGYQAALAG
jgi:glycosyltransferase involved in cell wall biosynthesis